MIYIASKSARINLPYEPGLLEWLQERYPASQYRVVEVA